MQDSSCPGSKQCHTIFGWLSSQPQKLRRSEYGTRNLSGSAKRKFSTTLMIRYHLFVKKSLITSAKREMYFMMITLSYVLTRGSTSSVSRASLKTTLRGHTADKCGFSRSIPHSKLVVLAQQGKHNLSILQKSMLTPLFLPRLVPINEKTW